MKNWPLLNSEEKYNSKPFKVVERTYKNPIKNTKFVASVLELPDWANIIAITSDNKVVLIRQFRFGTNKVELEIPGGVIESGEDPKIGAKRELLEETGYEVNLQDIELIGVVDSNPAIQNNKCFTFLAKNVINTGNQHLDQDEVISIELATLEKVREYIRNGKITNTYIIAAFYWLNLKDEFQ